MIGEKLAECDAGPLLLYYINLLTDDGNNYPFERWGINWFREPRQSNHAHSCILLTPLLLPACHNVNRFVASSLFLCRVIFPYSYRILLLP